jgi:EAL domain-containing protein (putative c-di-GMP-specific phosphodiesterase class I)
VETIDQLRRVRALDCDAAQGYLWSQAVEVDDFIPVVEGIRTSVGDPVGPAAPPTPVPSAVPRQVVSPARPGPRRRSHD